MNIQGNTCEFNLLLSYTLISLLKVPTRFQGVLRFRETWRRWRLIHTYIHTLLARPQGAFQSQITIPN